MHTVAQLEQALISARAAGYQVRFEWLAGSGGACEIKGRKYLFVDLALGPAEQLEQVEAALRQAADGVAAKADELAPAPRAATGLPRAA